MWAQAFENCTSLKNLTLQEGITQIDARAFKNCTSLTSVVLPASMGGTSGYCMSTKTFGGCTNLSKVEWRVQGPNVNKNTLGGYSFSNDVFSDCSPDIYLPNANQNDHWEAWSYMIDGYDSSKLHFGESMPTE